MIKYLVSSIFSYISAYYSRDKYVTSLDSWLLTGSNWFNLFKISNMMSCVSAIQKPVPAFCFCFFFFAVLITTDMLNQVSFNYYTKYQLSNIFLKPYWTFSYQIFYCKCECLWHHVNHIKKKEVIITAILIYFIVVVIITRWARF